MEALGWSESLRRGRRDCGREEGWGSRGRVWIISALEASWSGRGGGWGWKGIQADTASSHGPCKAKSGWKTGNEVVASVN